MNERWIVRPEDVRVLPPKPRKQFGYVRVKEWDESLHPRDDHGRFGEGSGADLPGGALAVPSELGDLNEQSREKWAAEMSQYGVTIAGLKAELLSKITPSAIEHAKTWYPAARDLSEDISKRTGIPLDKVAGALSAMSGRCEWKNAESGEGEVKYLQSMAQFVTDGKAQGLSTEDAVLAWKAEYKETNTILAFDENHERTGDPVGAKIMNSFAEKGMDILTGQKTIDEALPENKQRSFFDNIMNPGKTNEVTVDAIMMKSVENAYGVSFADATKFCGLDRDSQKNDVHVNGVGYIAISEAVREVADKYDVPPDVAEAAYWESVFEAQHIDVEDGKDWPSGKPRTEPKE